MDGNPAQQAADCKGGVAGRDMGGIETVAASPKTR